MHIHKPKAAHGVREFLSEIAVIVVGILIAIGIEQAVEAWHWAREVREARASLHREMDRTNEFFATRVAAEPCQKRRLDDTLAAIVEKIARHEPVPRVRPFHSIGNSLDDSDWESYRAAQVLPHFDPRERAIMNNYFPNIKTSIGRCLKNLTPITCCKSWSAIRRGSALPICRACALRSTRRNGATCSIASRAESSTTVAVWA